MPMSHCCLLSQRMRSVVIFFFRKLSESRYVRVRCHLLLTRWTDVVYVSGSLGVRREICQRIWTLSIFEREITSLCIRWIDTQQCDPAWRIRRMPKRIRNECWASIVANDSICIASIQRRLRVRNRTLSYAQNVEHVQQQKSETPAFFCIPRQTSYVYNVRPTCH